MQCIISALWQLPAGTSRTNVRTVPSSRTACAIITTIGRDSTQWIAYVSSHLHAQSTIVNRQHKISMTSRPANPHYCIRLTSMARYHFACIITWSHIPARRACWKTCSKLVGSRAILVGVLRKTLCEVHDRTMMYDRIVVRMVRWQNCGQVYGVRVALSRILWALPHVVYFGCESLCFSRWEGGGCDQCEACTLHLEEKKAAARARRGEEEETTTHIPLPFCASPPCFSSCGPLVTCHSPMISDWGVSNRSICQNDILCGFCLNNIRSSTWPLAMLLIVSSLYGVPHAHSTCKFTHVLLMRGSTVWHCFNGNS